MPAGAPVQPLDGLIIQRPCGERAGQRRDLPLVQPAQRQPQPVFRAPHQPLSRLVQAGAGPAVDHDGDYRVYRQPPQHERQGLHRLAVGPLQVIDHDRRARGLQLSQHLQQPRAHCERRGSRARPIGERGGRDGTSGRPGQLVNDPEVQIGLGLIATGPQQPRPGHPGQAAPHQGRLPHTRIALDGHQPRLPPSTRVMTSASWPSSAARPTKTSSGA